MSNHEAQTKPAGGASALTAGLERMFEEWAGNPPVEFADMDKDPVSFWCWKAWQKATETEQESRGMFVARLENMARQGDRFLTVEEVLALLSDCDMLAQRSNASAKGPGGSLPGPA